MSQLLDQGHVDPEVLADLWRMSRREITPQEQFEQRVSFVYSALSTKSKQHWPRDRVRDYLADEYAPKFSVKDHENK